jgi:hypothetical protein
MVKQELIAQITGFDTEFFAKGLGNDIRLKQMPDYALSDLALILQAAAEGKDAAILPPHPQSSFDRKDSSVIVRIDPNGKLTQNKWGSPEFSRIVYKAKGKRENETMRLNQMEHFPNRLLSTLYQPDDKPLRISSEAWVSDYKTTAGYIRDTDGLLKFDKATVDFLRLSGSVSHDAYNNDELCVPAKGPATYRFNGDWQKAKEIPADGSGAIEVKTFPFQHQLSVKRTTGKNQVRIDVTDTKKHSETVLKRFDGETTFSFSVLRSSTKPATPASGTIQIDLSTIEAGKISDLDDMALALLALSPAEIFD